MGKNKQFLRLKTPKHIRYQFVSGDIKLVVAPYRHFFWNEQRSGKGEIIARNIQIRRDKCRPEERFLTISVLVVSVYIDGRRVRHRRSVCRSIVEDANPVNVVVERVSVTGQRIR